MCNILDTIKKNLLAARKLRDTEVQIILSTIVGELQSEEKRGKKIDDEFVIAYIKKVMTNIRGNLALGVYDNNQKLKAEFELTVLEGFVPTQLSSEEIEAEIKESGLGSMGEIMKHFKSVYPGRYDGKLVSSIAKSYLGV